MTDQELEQRLRAWYRADIDDYEARQQLRTDLAALVGTAGSRRPLRTGWRFPAMNRFAPIALAATAVIVAILIGIGLLVRSPNVGPQLVPSSTPEPTAGPTAPAAGTWTAIEPMIGVREGFTATLLLDGRVLVAGGFDYDSGRNAIGFASAGLYEPSSGTWSATGSMIEARQGHQATLLLDGRVLVAGGTHFASAELYDPSTGEWTATGSMTGADVDTATRLLDGTVLVTGGDVRAELYDPTSGTWTSTGNVAWAGRRYHSATLLLDGRVLVAGGLRPADRAGNRPAFAELYDPSTGEWTATESMTMGHWEHTATLLPDGTVLIAGGEGSTRSAELYDPLTGTWARTGNMITDRYAHTATLLPDGTVLVTGGPNLYDAGAPTELYDPSRGTWTATANLPVAVSRSKTTLLLLDGTVLLLSSGQTDDFASAALYDPGT